MQRTVQRKRYATDFVFNYSGGEYIEVAFKGYRAHDVINVWDYEKGESRIKNTKTELNRAITDYLDNLTPDEVQNWKDNR